MLLIPLVDRAGYILVCWSSATPSTRPVRSRSSIPTPDPSRSPARRRAGGGRHRELAAHGTVIRRRADGCIQPAFISCCGSSRRASGTRASSSRTRSCSSDVDNLKPVNDRFGHSAGDGMLTTLSRLLSAQSRGFTVIARLGGDEFGAVLPQTPKAGALQYAERIRRLIEAYPFSSQPGHGERWRGRRSGRSRRKGGDTARGADPAADARSVRRSVWDAIVSHRLPRRRR